MLLQALVFATLPLQLALASPAPAQSSGAVGDILNGLLGDPEGYGFADLGGDVEVMSLIRGVKNALSGDTSLCHAAVSIMLSILFLRRLTRRGHSIFTLRTRLFSYSAFFPSDASNYCLGTDMLRVYPVQHPPPPRPLFPRLL